MFCLERGESSGEEGLAGEAGLRGDHLQEGPTCRVTVLMGNFMCSVSVKKTLGARPGEMTQSRSLASVNILVAKRIWAA